MAISIEKYATWPELGKFSYENGFKIAGCMDHFSAPHSIHSRLDAAIWG
jgi:hypothetical protein